MHYLLIVRQAIILIQSCYLVLQCINTVKRYYQTYDTLLQFEICFMVLLTMMMLILAPNYLLFNNLNWFAFCLFFNSMGMQLAGYHLHNKVHDASVYGGR